MKRLGRLLLSPLAGYVHPGAYGCLAFVCIGLALDLLSLPPGPLPFLVLVAEVPFLVLLFRDDGKRWKRWAWLYGMLHFGFALRWLAQIHPVQVVGAAVVLGPIYVLLGGAIRWSAARRVPFGVAVGLAVVLEELLRTIWMGGMPWPSRSLSFASGMPFDLGFSALLPAAAFFGAYAFSFLAGLTSAVAYRVLTRPAPEPGSLGLRGLVPLLQPLAVVGLLSWWALLGSQRVEASGTWQAGTPEDRPVLVAVQADIPQDLKHGTSEETKAMFDRHLSLSATAIRQLGADRVLGVVWPETMVPWPFLDADLAHRFPDFWEHQVGVLKRIKDDVPEAQHLPWMLGVIHKFRRPGQRHWLLWDGAAYGTHDSLMLVDPSQAPGMEEETPLPPAPGEKPAWEVARHDKTKLVPGGEYTPLGEWLPPLRWFRNFVSVIPELDPGAEEQAPFVLGAGEDAVRAGTIICFEVAFPARCRAWRRQGAQVLLNAANYGWFGPTGFRWQIASLARLRAAELGVTVVMAGNTGPTAFYGPRGEVYGTFRALGESEAGPAGPVDTTMCQGWASAPLRTAWETPYVGWGDWPWLALALSFLILGTVRGRRDSRQVGSLG